MMVEAQQDQVRPLGNQERQNYVIVIQDLLQIEMMDGDSEFDYDAAEIEENIVNANKIIDLDTKEVTVNLNGAVTHGK